MYNLLKNILIVILFLLIPFAFFAGLQTARQESPIVNYAPYVQQEIDGDVLFSQVQAWRETQGHPTYAVDNDLCNLALIRAFEVQTDWSHDGFYPKIHSGQYGRYDFYGENLAFGFDAEAEYLEGWLNSPTHKENLEYQFKFSCIRCINGYCAQEFAI